MDNNIENLEEEIILLKKRISILEGKENRRKAYSYFKIIIKIVFFFLLVFSIWKGYDYVVNEVPDLIKDEIANLTKSSIN